MKALMLGVPFTAVNSAVTTAVEGTPFAMPFKSYPTVVPLIVPVGSVSAQEYKVVASVDGVTYIDIVTGLTTQADFVNSSYLLIQPIVRIDQVSRTGGTSQAVVVTLAQY